MAHVAKYSKSACGHMCAHYERRIDDNGEYIKFGNESIDTTKTHLNYNLAPHNESQIDFIKKRCSEVKCLKRNDVKVMCSWVVTLPKDFPRKDEDEFFKKTYKFLEDKYNKENVVSAYVHKDEVTPHMHFAFVPVVYDLKKDINKISAKERITRQDLKTFHNELEKHLRQHFNFEVNILNENTKEGNKAIKELKRGTAQEEINNITLERRNALLRLKKVEECIKSLEDEKKLLEIKLEAYKGGIDSIRDIPVGKTNRLFKTTTFKTEEANQLIETAKAYFKNESYTENAIKESKYIRNTASYKKNVELEKKLEQSKDTQCELFKENRDMKEINQRYENRLKKIEKILNKYPEIKEVIERELKQSKSINRGISMDM